jgi:hypothetical protein
LVRLLTLCVESSDSDDHFSDAHSGLDHSGTTSPVVPLTGVEKVDDEASHGEVPGTHTYNMRRTDAEPYEVAVLRDPDDLGPGASGGQTPTPGGHPIPKTVLEKVDASLSHGEIPGTLAHRQRAKDAVPDIVVQASNRGSTDGSGPGDLSAVVTKGEQDFKRTEDEPDLSEEAKDALGMTVITPVVQRTYLPGSPTSHGLKSAVVTRSRRTSSGASRRSMKDKQNEGEVAEGVFGDDFDDFEEGEEDADFDDFDDGFQEAEPIQSQSTPPTFSFVSNSTYPRKFTPLTNHPARP